MSNKRRKTENTTEDEEDFAPLTDKKNSLDIVRNGVSELARKRNHPVSIGLKKPEPKEKVDVDLLDPLRSLSRTHTFVSNSVVEIFEQRLGQLECARDQISRHPLMKTHYNATHIDILVNRIPSDLRAIVRALAFNVGRMPSAILVKDPSGRMDIIFDTRPSSDYCCCSIEPRNSAHRSAFSQDKNSADLDTNIATILSLKNRVISMDELLELFKDGNPNQKRGGASTAKPAMGLAAMSGSSLFTPLSSDTGTADAFDKLFMKNLFTFSGMFQCTAVHLDFISPSGHSICHNKIVFASV